MYHLSFKRVVCLTVSVAILSPATLVYAASPGYTRTVNQLPGVYTVPPDVNIMFTLDDSGSMYSDSIPDIPAANAAGMPVDGNSNGLGQANATFPGMWKAGSNYLTAPYYSLNNPIARYLRSSAGNPLYYNPSVLYAPWPLASDDKLLNANANVRRVNISQWNPFATGRQLDLTVSIVNGGQTIWLPTYFNYTGVAPLPPANPNTPLNIEANFQKVEIKPTVTSYPKSASRTDCVGATCSYAEELQNFANWLQYYRSRNLMAKGGVAAAFAKQANNIRVGFASLNTPGAVIRGVSQFAGTNRTAFYNEMYAIDENGGTQLRLAMDNVGRYFQRSDIGNPWAEDPTSTTTKGTEYACRRSFHIMSTDGFWNGAAASSVARNNNDNFSGTTPKKPDGTEYNYSDTTLPSSDPLVDKFTINPFSDTLANTLADVSAYYWKTDLRIDLPNSVFPSQRDPAFWQHLTTFTIGLGINGTGGVRRASDSSTTVPLTEASSSPYRPYVGQAWLSNPALRDLLVANKTALTWTTPTADSQATGDDLIHAAMNGRGRYFSATDPTVLANGLAAALSEVADQPLDLAALAADGTQLRANGRAYQGTFNPDKWYGRLYSFKQNALTGVVNNRPSVTGNINPDQLWEASLAMPLPTARAIYTSNGLTATGTNFSWTNLTGAQKTALRNDSRLVDYLRGDISLEVQSGGPFRDRARYTLGATTGGILGDIINGSPVKGPDEGGGYERLPASDLARAAYPLYRTGAVLEDMRNTVFVGANDGMLHAFNIVDGVERFAYVPNGVYRVPRSTAGGATEDKLALLSDIAYSHRFTVDGPPNVADAFYDNAWKTVLAASFGAGARGVFAIDVTKTEVGTGKFGAGKILWEYTERENPRMGFSMGYPHIARMRNGQWAAIFGNGVDSVNGGASLFIVNVETGALIKQLDAGANGENGLSQPNVVLNSNREVVAVYAGDVKGNLWKFDVSGTNPTTWNTAFSNTPLYSSTTSTGYSQPITVMPEITAHPNGGAMIMYGTGKLLENGDTAATNPPNVNLAKQTIYAIWDKPGESNGITATRSSVLLEQTSNAVAAADNFGTTSQNVPNWGYQRGWFMDLQTGGERITIAPQFLNGVLFNTANTIVVDPCSNGGTSRIIAVDAITGRAPTFNVFATGNVRIDRGGIATQPLLQYTLSTGSGSGSTTKPWSNDRGQLSGAKPGGIELGREGEAPCNNLLSYARSNTTLEQLNIKTCNKKARVSWRQLR